ncbi:MAG: DNA repair protein RecO [Desulfobacterota bacterium]|nr:DNA repair protein RecO [Thermodesulfobacteriota bacterium]
MPRYSTEAIILNAIDFLESDKIIHALTREQGLITAIAKGAHRSRKRFPGTLEPFCEVCLEVHKGRGSDLQRIESAVLINANLSIREDLALLGYSAVLLEMVKENLGPYDPVPATYECLRNSLAVLDAGRQWFPLWSFAMVNLLRLLGYGIELESFASRRDHPDNPSPGGLSAEACMFLEKGSRMGREVLCRVNVSAQGKREITLFLLRMCTRVSVRPLKTVAFLAKLLDLDMNQCYMG